MEMRVREISVGMQGIWVEIQKILEFQGIKVET